MSAQTTLPATHHPDVTLDPALRIAYQRLVEGRFGLRPAGPQAERIDTAVLRLAARAFDGDAGRLLSTLENGARPDLLEDLAASLTIGETHFFRVTPQIEALRRVVLPNLIGRRAAVRRLLLWSAGCSTGEEAYTLAILVREQLPAPDGWDVQLLATDINRAALTAAVDARYGEWSFRDTPSDVRQRYFGQDDRRWRLIDPIRKMVRFAHLNLAEPAESSATSGWPTHTAFDLIVCRNVTIYFSAQTTQRVYQRLANSLAPDGWLLLGPSDPAPEARTGLQHVNAPGAILWRRIGAGPGPSVTPFTAAVSKTPAAPARGSARRAATPAATSRPPGSAVRARSGPGSYSPRPVSSADAQGSVRSEIERIWQRAHAGDRETARSEAAALSKRWPGEAEPHVLHGLLCLEAGALEVAAESLRRATFLDPNNALAHLWLGRAYRSLGQRPRADAAVLHARRLVAALPDDYPLPGGHGITAGDLRRAVGALKPEGREA